MFREANIIRKLIPKTTALGAFTFTMTAVSGTPQIQNLSPIQYFETSPTATPTMGFRLLQFYSLVVYSILNGVKKYTVKGIVFDEPSAEKFEEKNLPNLIVAIFPLIVVIVALNFVPSLINLSNFDPNIS